MGTISEQLNKEIKICNRNLLKLKKALNWYNQQSSPLGRRASLLKKMVEEDFQFNTNRIKWIIEELNKDGQETPGSKMGMTVVKLTDADRKLLIKQVNSFIKDFVPETKMKRIEIMDEGIDETIAFHLNVALNILTNLNGIVKEIG